MPIIYRIEDLVPTSERYQKYYWLKYMEPTSHDGSHWPKPSARVAHI